LIKLAQEMISAAGASLADGTLLERLVLDGQGER